MGHQSWVVLKFGGTSVSSKERWETIAEQLGRVIEEGYRPFLVCSAVSQVSNQLESLLQKSVSGDVDAALKDIEDKHRTLCAELDVSWEGTGLKWMDELRRMILGISLVREVSSRIHARVLATGELMSTSVGAAFLKNRGLPVSWLDAREALHSSHVEDSVGTSRAYLSAVCGYAQDPDLAESLTGEAYITQGFIASNDAGDTVLLGRGGSDTSAAYFASKLNAERCEIWTDVPGLYSANPKLIPDAHLLLRMGYDEAQELASAGAKVLHPRCIAPLREFQVPLQVRSTREPTHPGTLIDRSGGDSRGQVRAISTKRGINLISMETVGMWQEVGFLADAFAIFKKRGLSIDLISTSETNVTVSLDVASNAVSPEELDALVVSLNDICQARRIGPCASVSLVGRKIRGILHQLGSALELFEEHSIHLVSQAANDLNLTFVVEETQADRLVLALHTLLFGAASAQKNLGPSWRSSMWEGGESSWWRRKREQLIALGEELDAVFVYDKETLAASARTLLDMDSVDHVHYSIKANPHPDIIRLFGDLGVGFECVSPGEVQRVLDVLPHIDRTRVLFTPNFASKEEYAFGFAEGVRVTLDNAHPLKHWGEVFRDKSFFIRVDPGQGRGHHEHVRTAGAQSKFGIEPDELVDVAEYVKAIGGRVTGLHSHAGSGILTPEGWAETAVFQAKVARVFPEVSVLNLGGGLGIVEKPGQHPLALHQVNESLNKFKEAHPGFELWMEPGRFLVGSAGVLLARVTQVKRKGDVNYVGIKTGMNSLIRPALYGAYHEIVNLSKLDEPRTLVAHIVGPICETGDTLGYARTLAPTEEGDIVLIGTAGAYGRAMSSHYNLRAPAVERLLE